MSRRRDNYETTWWYKFKRWVDGDIDPFGKSMEVKLPRKRGERRRNLAQRAAYEKELNRIAETQADKTEIMKARGIRYFQRFYRVMSVVLCLGIILILLWTVASLPVTGNASNPHNNEVAARYIEKGLQATGAVHLVTGMFLASCCVLVLLRLDQDSENESVRKMRAESDDRHFEPKNDIILQKCACVLTPIIMIFGIYIVLNGHLSPGGGFSGVVVLGSCLILYLNFFGFENSVMFFYLLSFFGFIYAG